MRGHALPLKGASGRGETTLLREKVPLCRAHHSSGGLFRLHVGFSQATPAVGFFQGVTTQCVHIHDPSGVRRPRNAAMSRESCGERGHDHRRHLQASAEMPSTGLPWSEGLRSRWRHPCDLASECDADHVHTSLRVDRRRSPVGFAVTQELTPIVVQASATALHDRGKGGSATQSCVEPWGAQTSLVPWPPGSAGTPTATAAGSERGRR